VTGLVAIAVEGLLIQAHFTPAEDGLPLLVEADAVGDEQPVLAAVEARWLSFSGTSVGA
jgi:hypothetical protein